MNIKNLADLCEFLGADEPRQMNKRLFKATDCGASISLYFTDRDPAHSGSWENWPLTTDCPTCRGFTIQTIVEGSEVTVNSDEFVFPVTEEHVDTWIRGMEAQAKEAWNEANDEWEEEK